MGPAVAPPRPTETILTSPPTASSLDLDAALRRFGHQAFRPGQREAIETLLGVGRLLLVAPTGGGKSLTYQLPASLLSGTTLVVSPLIALMHDQVEALGRNGVAATYLAATLGASEAGRRQAALARGEFRLAYVAPERLAQPGFRSLLADLECPLVAVDEAHCISEWGHDFRPEYHQIGDVLAALPTARVLACTATATPIVRDEILAKLGLDPGTPQLVHGFARPNLSLRAAEVSGRAERERRVDAALAEALAGPGRGRGKAIVYAPTRRSAEEEAARLGEAGWRCRFYHAGLDGDGRRDAQRAFSAGELDLVVATNAFGMGIDEPDVRAVVHLGPPGSLEAYYQEVGRAGRDGAPALGLLLFAGNDLPLRRRLLERGDDGASRPARSPQGREAAAQRGEAERSVGPREGWKPSVDRTGRAPRPELLEHKWNLFLELLRWAEGGSCRHDAILRYFGDEEETLAGCGVCDVCRRLADGPDTEEFTPEEASVIVRKALSGVARAHGRFGLGAVVKLLRGESDERLERSGLARVSTFGVLSDHRGEWLTQVLRRCVTAGFVDFAGEDRPVVRLTEAGARVMRGELPPRLVLPPTGRGRATQAVSLGQRRKPSGAQRGAAERRSDGKRSFRAQRGAAERRSDGMAEPAHAETPTERALFEALRAHRLELSKRFRMRPYVIASDRTLRDIARRRPRTREELLLVDGIGPARAERFGDGLLAVVRRHAS